jgi:regulation of enolase protein 1 (concanavalin A-like superfamily)
MIATPDNRARRNLVGRPVRRLRPFSIAALLLLTCVGVQADQLPAPWLGSDIGSSTQTGNATATQSTFTITATGTDIWGASDQFHFVYQPISGDVEILARVDSIFAADPWSKAGVMIRASLNASAAHAFALVSSSKGIAFQRRRQSGGVSVNTSGPAAGAAPAWVRLVRAGTQITAYWSSDGKSWTTIGSDTVTLNSTVYVGLAVTSHNPAVSTTATLSNVATNTTALPSPQKSDDIGSPAVAGSARYASGTYSIAAGGQDIWNASDQFRFVYQQITGDVDVRARIASLTAASDWTKAGVMIRETLAPNARNAFALVSASHGMRFQRRIDAGGLTVGTDGGAGVAPLWVRLVRSGLQITAYRSADGTTWTTIATDTVPMGDSVYVGIAVTAHATSGLASADVDHFSVSASTNQPPSVSLTAPTAGSSFIAPAAITLTATAADPENQLSQVQFYSGSTLLATDTAAPYSFTWSGVAAGTYTIKAVATDAGGLSRSSATITITVTSATDTPPTTVIFHASSDHAIVTSYRLDIFSNGADPNTATPVATSNLGKPTPDASGDISLNRATFFSSLAPGTYVATVSAIGSGGSGRSTPITFTR